jgi:hypothetical protein
VNPRNWPPYACQLRTVSPADFAALIATPGQVANLNPGSMFAVMNGGAFVALWGKFQNGDQPGDFSLVAPSGATTPYWVFVTTTADLPAAVGGVITLADGVNYIFTTQVDLGGARLVAGRDTTILGGSSESSRILSTGLVGTPLITSQWSLPMRNVTLEADVALALDATANPGCSLDWYGVNLTDCGSCGTITGYNNAIFTSCALLGSGGLTFDGTFNTVAFNNSLLSPDAGATAVTIAPTCTIARRFRITFSSVVVVATATGIAVPNLASFPAAESFGLDTVAFTGAGTYLSGITQADSPAAFFACTGIANSAAIASYYASNNATPTNCAVQGTFYKIVGLTFAGPDVSQFALTDNRATYTGARVAYFHIQGLVSLTDGTNRDIAIRVAVNGVTIPASQSVTNTGSAGRSQTVPVQGVISLSPGQYVELWAANLSATGNLIATDLSVVVERIAA